MSLPKHPLELLAPARSAEIAREAILHGADAVYIGGPAFGARHAAGNSLADIAELARFAHRFHAKVFVALNTILHDDELEAARQLAWQVHDAGVDALIVQDMGLLELDLPPMALHASTQCDIRTPEKAAFLAACGFSQLVLARELTLAEIAAVRAAVPAHVMLEHFVHGALCVAYSGQCYLSHAMTGRSANRGECSQPCRLPLTLHDEQGRVLAADQHLLSLKDNDQSAHLAALVDAGIGSFKIEGRLKDMAYVKNITGHYRRLLDALIEARPPLSRASSGTTRLLFTPDPARAFNRGHTDYFTHGRQIDIVDFTSPKFTGPVLGSVTRVLPDSFLLDSALPLANGDGLNYPNGRELAGLQANVVKPLGENRWQVWPNEAMRALPGLRPGTIIRRNRDHAWEQMLAQPSAKRSIGITLDFEDTPTGFRLQVQDEDGIRAEACLLSEKQAARQPERFAESVREQLGKLGNTPFQASHIGIACSQPWFLPASQLNALRRDAIAALENARLAANPRAARLAASEPPAPYPATSLDYLGNVYNEAAKRFYSRHGVSLIAPAFEAHAETGEVCLMSTRHCLRYSFKLCPKQVKGERPEPMQLQCGQDRFTLHFDCKRCIMQVYGKIRSRILRSTPPGKHAEDAPE